MPDVALRVALPSDAPGVAACVCEVYVQYIERIGKQPGPMLENYAHVIAEYDRRVIVGHPRVFFRKALG